MSYRGARGGGATAGGGGGPRLSAAAASSPSTAQPHRNRGAGPSASATRGWGTPSPQTNGGTPRQASQNQHHHHHHQQQQQQQQHNSNQSPSTAATVTPFPSLAKATGPTSGTSSQAIDNVSQAAMRDRTSFVIVSLIGNTVTVKTRSGTRYVGILHSSNIEAKELGVALTHAQELKADGSLGSPIPSLVIKGSELDSIDASEVTLGEPVKTTSDGFRTDVEISARTDPFGEGRTLQKWSDDPGLNSLDSGLESSFAAQANNAVGNVATGSGAWDQFAANEARFGVKSNYEENLYTTKLDRSGKDFKEREKRAERLAAEIMGTSSVNPHIAEERNQAAADDSGRNEEDKYGAVVRGPNAYVPPAARRAAEAAAAVRAGKDVSASNDANAGQIGSAPAAIVNTVVVENSNGSSGTPGIAIKLPTPPEGMASSATAEAFTPSTAPTTSAATSATANNEKLTSDFRHFVSSERQRILREKQNALAGAQAKAEREKQAKLAELKNWSSSFKLKTPMPDDVAEVIHKTSASEKPRDPSLAKSMSPTTAHTQNTGAGDSTGRAGPTAGAAGTASVVASPAGGAGTAALPGVSRTGPIVVSKGNVNAQLVETKSMLAKMTIPKIPPFNPEKAKARQAAAAAAKLTESKESAAKTTVPPSAGQPAISPAMSNSSVAFRMSAKASSFKPFNPAAASFTPGGVGGGTSSGAAAATQSSAASSATPKPPKPEQRADPVISPSPVAAGVAAAGPAASKQINPTATSMAVQAANPFFGSKVLKRSTHPIHMRDDFNPFKAGKVAESNTIAPSWPYTGKSYLQVFSTVASPLAGGQQLGLPASPEDGTAHPGAMSLGGMMHSGASIPSTPGSHHSTSVHPHALHHSLSVGQTGHMGFVASQSPGMPLNMMVPGTPTVGSAAPPHAPSPYGMVYQPQPGGPGHYRFPQGQYVVQGGMSMASPPGGPYGPGMPPQYIGGAGQQNGGGVVHPHHVGQGVHQHHLHQSQQQQGSGHPIHIQQMQFQGQQVGVGGTGVPPYQGMYSPQLGNMQAVPVQYLPMAAPPSGNGQQPPSTGGSNTPAPASLGGGGPSTTGLGNNSSSGPPSNAGSNNNVPTGPAGGNNNNNNHSAPGGVGKGPASLPQPPPPSLHYPPGVGVQQSRGGGATGGVPPPQFGSVPLGGSAGGGQGHYLPYGGPRGHYQGHQQQQHHHPQPFQQQQHQHHHSHQIYPQQQQQQQHHGGYGGGGGGGHAPPPSSAQHLHHGPPPQGAPPQGAAAGTGAGQQGASATPAAQGTTKGAAGGGVEQGKVAAAGKD